MSPTVGFYAIFRTPQNAGLVGTYTVACAVKCHGSMLTCVLEACMLPLPRTKSDWLEIAWGLAKICFERHPVTCHSLLYLQ